MISIESSVCQDVSDKMLKPGLFLMMFSQVLLKKTCDSNKEKCDPLGKLRKQLKMPDKSSSVFRSDGKFNDG